MHRPGARHPYCRSSQDETGRTMPDGNEVDRRDPWFHGWRRWLGLAIVLVIAAGAVWLALFTIRTFRSLNVEVAAAIVSALAAIAIAVVTTWYGRLLERQAAADRAQQEKRTPAYEKFVHDLLETMELSTHRDERSGEVDTRRAVQSLASFTEQAIVWGSGDVLKAWVEFRDLGRIGDQVSDTQQHGLRLMAQLETLFLAMRFDLGLDNEGLARGDLLRLFINDLDPAALDRLGDQAT